MKPTPPLLSSVPVRLRSLREPTFLLVFLTLMASVIACGDDSATPPTGDGESFQVEVIAPGIAAPLRLRSVLEIRGETTVAGPFYSLDGRQSWQLLPEFPIFEWQWVSDTSGVYPRTDGTLVYLDLATRETVNHSPDEGSPWLIVGGELVTLVQEEVSASEQDGPGIRARLWTIPADGSDDTWTSVPLPVMPEADRTYQPSLHHGENGEIYVVGRYGMYRGEPAPGASWEFYPLIPEGGSISWDDNPVWVSRSGTIVVSTRISFDGGETFEIRDRNDEPWEHQDVNGDLYIGGLISTDGGQSWQPTMSEDIQQRLDANASMASNTIRGRPGETHVQISEFMYLVVTEDGRIESLVPHEPGNPDSDARNAADVIEFPDGRLLGLGDGQLLRYTPGDRGWEWLLSTPLRTTLQTLSDGRVAMLIDNGSAGGAIRFSEDMGETWSEARATPILHAIYEYEDEWVGKNRGSCGIVYYTSTDEFLTWEQREEFSFILGTDGEPVEAPFQFDARVQLPDGALVGNATGYQISLNGDCQVTIGQPARSTDRAIIGVRMNSDDMFRARVVGANSRGGIAAIAGENQREVMYLYRNGAWIRVGTPYFGERELRIFNEFVIAQPGSYIDRADHLVMPSAEGLVRTLVPFR